MIPLPSGTKIWLVAGITDMRNGFNGLAAKVQTTLKDDPMSGHVFIFRGRNGSQVKLLWSTGDGLCLLTKRLERGRFAWPSARDGKVFLTPAQLAMLLEGIDWRQPKRLLTSLLTFSLEHNVDAVPAYRHETPENVFLPLLSLLNHLLEASLPSRVVFIELKQKGVMWEGALHDARLREGADFWLSVRSSMPGHELQTKFPQLCKAGSPDDVSEVVNVALSGVIIRPVTHVPAAIPLRLENQYFALDLSTDAARAMLDAGRCTFYTPASLGDVKLELFAVLRT
ncbi:TPA: IS66 family insertion sequence element accessory protein TnpB [Escherichia coli]|nr:IS66 family insertion sequence element accessory protein TnpB [Escherichia coli]